MKRIKVGVIGTGFIGTAHIEALERIPFVHVAALADEDKKTTDKKASEMGIETTFSNYKKLIECAEIEAVHICTPNYLHYTMAKEALLCGKNVLCEKPLAMTSTQAKELTEIADARKLSNAVGFNLRYYPMVQQIKAMIAAGELGTLLAVNGSYQQDWLLYESDCNWRLDSKYSGISRAVYDIGSHWLDMVENITGLRIQEVIGDFAIFHKQRKMPMQMSRTFCSEHVNKEYKYIDISTEDYATILLRFDKKAHGSLTVNQAAAGRKNRIFFEIYGTQKSVSWNGEKPNELWIGNRDAPNQKVLKDPHIAYPAAARHMCFPGGHNEGFPDTLKQFFMEFYTHILHRENGKESFIRYPAFKDGLRELEIGESIVKSSKNNSWETIY